MACGALSSPRDNSGAPLMASVATDARLRGQGLGAALTGDTPIPKPGAPRRAADPVM